MKGAQGAGAESDGAGGKGGDPPPVPEGFFQDLIEELRRGGARTKDELLDLKIHLCRMYGLPRIPRDSEILARVNETLPPAEAEALLPLLRKKPFRTISGIAPVAVMTSPHQCPHGTCAYCPGGPGKGTAQSYTGMEPASLRAGSHGFDPYLQVRSRVEQLEAIGHPTDKVELIVMGGTFTARTPKYQDAFLRGCFQGLNAGEEGWDPTLVQHADEDGEVRVIGDDVGGFAYSAIGVGDAMAPRGPRGPGPISSELEACHTRNETAPHRCVGLTIETRPDQCDAEAVDRILAQGGTRVELGVQNLDDRILEGVKRGHGSKETAVATALLKDAGLKVGYHLMPFLPGSDEGRELRSFERAFTDPAFKPDLIKIYPTLVVEGTPLHAKWSAGEYEAADTTRAARLVALVKTMVPQWVRISRIQRDIPLKAITAGVEKSNLRQLAGRLLEEDGRECRCIRCREVGHRLGDDFDVDSAEVVADRMDYDASGGREVFISRVIPEHDALVGFLRLRLPSPEAGRPGPGAGGRSRPGTLPGGASVIRELKVLGPMAPIPGGGDHWQHRGWGRALIDEAARISRDEWGVKRMLVTSGVGAREYYRRLGFERAGPYMGLGL